MGIPIVISAECKIDTPNESIDTKIEQVLRGEGKKVVVLTIDSLSAGWDTSREDNHFRSGNAPIEALERAYGLIARGNADCVVIYGRDHLKSDYKDAGGKERRNKQMNIYHGTSIPEAYTRLAFEFMKIIGINAKNFREITASLFGNYIKTAKERGVFKQPEPERYELLTDLFRHVDCANPSVDFEGKIVLGNEEVAKIMEIPENERVYLLSAKTSKLKEDGPKNIPEIAEYNHLHRAYTEASEQAGVDFKSLYLDRKALLEIYTCFPIVPLAFLLKAGITSLEKIDDFLKHHEITVTGGMNLAKAPWNNPALHASIVMINRLKQEKNVDYGGIHGNGGLGYKQGFAIFGKES